MEFHVLKPKHLPFLPLFLLSLSACTERIAIETEGGDGRLIIYGYITNESAEHAIRITRSNSYFAQTKPEGVSGALVTVRSDTETFAFTESDTEPGLYRTAPGTAGTEGSNYTLHVSLDFDGDGQAEEFEASSRLPLAARLDSIGVRQSPVFDEFMEIRFYGRLPDNAENYLSIHAYINNTALNDSLPDFTVVGGKYLVQKELNGLPCFYLNQEEDGKLSWGDYVSLRVDVLTKEYTDFLDNAASEAQGSIPLFSNPPANVETNIRSLNNPSRIPVSGFFSAFSSSRAGMYYYGND